MVSEWFELRRPHWTWIITIIPARTTITTFNQKGVAGENAYCNHRIRLQDNFMPKSCSPWLWYYSLLWISSTKAQFRTGITTALAWALYKMGKLRSKVPGCDQISLPRYPMTSSTLFREKHRGGGWSSWPRDPRHRIWEFDRGGQKDARETQLFEATPSLWCPPAASILKNDYLLHLLLHANLKKILCIFISFFLLCLRTSVLCINGAFCLQQRFSYKWDTSTSSRKRANPVAHPLPQLLNTERSPISVGASDWSSIEWALETRTP